MKKSWAFLVPAVWACLIVDGNVSWAQTPADLLQRLDKNLDGKLSQLELPLRMRDRFDQLDADGDGLITEKELIAWSSKQKKLRVNEEGAQPVPAEQSAKPATRSTAGRTNAQGEFYAPPALQERVDSKLQVGDLAPAFSLRQYNSGGTVELTQFRGDRPVVLVFGSITCSPFRRQVLEVFEISKEFSSKAQFLMIYIREAHPDSTILMPDGRGQPALRKFSQTESLSARTENAASCAALLQPPFPVLIDGEDNKTLADYGAWPNRLVVVGKDGRIAWDSGEGPRGFQPQKLNDWLRTNL